MNKKSSVMTVIAGLALATTLPAHAQIVGGALGGAGNVVLGGGGSAGGATANGALHGDLQDRAQAARERAQTTTESTVERGQDTAASTRAAARSGVQKTREGTEQAAKSASTSGSATSSGSVEKSIGKRTVRADNSAAADYSADRSGVIVNGSQAANASMTRDAPESGSEPTAAK